MRFILLKKQPQKPQMSPDWNPNSQVLLWLAFARCRFNRDAIEIHDLLRNTFSLLFFQCQIATVIISEIMFHISRAHKRACMPAYSFLLLLLASPSAPFKLIELFDLVMPQRTQLVSHTRASHVVWELCTFSVSSFSVVLRKGGSFWESSLL
jgi:hypothetical protein